MRYRIGSFNLKNFGAYPRRDFEKIADIIRKEELDVVAFQEILSEGKGLENLLRYYVEHEFYNWDFCWASPRESSDIAKIGELIVNDSRGEGYAYIWNKQLFKLAEFSELGRRKSFEPRIINSMSNDVYADCSFYARTPYYIRLQPCYGGFFEFRLINLHIYFGSNTLSDVQKRQLEYETLVKDIYPAISQRRYGDFRPAYTIAMGDYNLNIFRPHIPNQSSNYLQEVYNFKDFQVITVQDQLTTLKTVQQSSKAESGYANNYDHFTYSPELLHSIPISCHAIDAVSKYCDGDFEYYRTNISDHLPIIMEIEI